MSCPKSWFNACSWTLRIVRQLLVHCLPPGRTGLWLSGGHLGPELRLHLPVSSEIWLPRLCWITSVKISSDQLLRIFLKGHLAHRLCHCFILPASILLVGIPRRHRGWRVRACWAESSDLLEEDAFLGLACSSVPLHENNKLRSLRLSSLYLLQGLKPDGEDDEASLWWLH